MQIYRFSIPRRPAGRICVALAVSLFAAGGCESSGSQHVRRMMWYRQPPPGRVAAHTMGIGRYGDSASYGTWPGSGVSDEGVGIAGVQAGRVGSTGSYATWGPTDVGGAPIANGSVSARSGQAGTTLGVTGGTSSVGEWPDRGATFGTGP